MERNLEISFNSPQCGWMSIGFSDGVSEFHTTTAHAPYARALPELMRILTHATEIDITYSETTLKWNRDPEEFDFRFARQNGRLTIEIFQYPTDERELSERELVFSHTGATHDVVLAFAKTFEQLYRDRETDEFEFNWREAFPYSEYENLKSKLVPA